MMLSLSVYLSRENEKSNTVNRWERGRIAAFSTSGTMHNAYLNIPADNHSSPQSLNLKAGQVAYFTTSDQPSRKVDLDAVLYMIGHTKRQKLTAPHRFGYMLSFFI